MIIYRSHLVSNCLPADFEILTWFKMYDGSLRIGTIDGIFTKLLVYLEKRRAMALDRDGLRLRVSRALACTVLSSVRRIRVRSTDMMM